MKLAREIVAGDRICLYDGKTFVRVSAVFNDITNKIYTIHWQYPNGDSMRGAYMTYFAHDEIEVDNDET